MKRYRITFSPTGDHPEHVTVDAYVGWLAVVLEGFSVFYHQGWWRGQPEESVTIEYIGSFGAEPKLRIAAEHARTFFNQKSVLFTVEDIQAEFITA